MHDMTLMYAPLRFLLWQAHDILSQPDVIVTSMKDKEKMLPKLLTLNEKVIKQAADLPDLPGEAQPLAIADAAFPVKQLMFASACSHGMLAEGSPV